MLLPQLPPPPPPRLHSTQGSSRIQPVCLKRVFLLEWGTPLRPGAQGLSHAGGKPGLFPPRSARTCLGQTPRWPGGQAASFEPPLRGGGKDQQSSSLLRVTCSGGQCHHGMHMHLHAHTCKCGPTRSHWADDREPPNRQDLKEGPRSRTVPTPGPHPPGKGSGNTAKAAGTQDRVRPRPGQEENRMQPGRQEGRAEAAQATGKVLGWLVRCPEQNSVFTAQPLRAWN